VDWHLTAMAEVQEAGISLTSRPVQVLRELIVAAVLGRGGAGGNGLGGGVYMSARTFSVVNTTIHVNKVTGQLGGSGGGSSVVPSRQKGTDGSGRGGGILQTGTGQTSLNSLTIARNEVTSIYQNGFSVGSFSGFAGGIRNEGSDLV